MIAFFNIFLLMSGALNTQQQHSQMTRQCRVNALGGAGNPEDSGKAGVAWQPLTPVMPSRFRGDGGVSSPIRTGVGGGVSRGHGTCLTKVTPGTEKHAWGNVSGGAGDTGYTPLPAVPG